jgi:CspA family cold shock protein
MKGKVKSFLVRKGWGFIRAENGVECFCHHSDIKTDHAYKVLVAGQEVEFDVVKTDRGYKAVNIRPTDVVTEEVVHGSSSTR